MSQQYREIESKLLVHGSSLEAVNSLMGHLLAKRKQRMIYGYSRDVYWNTHSPDIFVRVRERDGITQVTVKREDGDGHFNRLEIDLNCTSPVVDAINHHTTLFGEPAGVIEKKYYVYFTDPKTTVCCYQCTIDGQERPEIVIEVEGPEAEEVKALTQEVREFYAVGTEIVDAPGSLYTMYLKDRKWAHSAAVYVHPSLTITTEQDTNQLGYLSNQLKSK